MGDNMNGPSLIKVPPWIRNPLGRYYLYYAQHKGRFIGLAYADTLDGPWHVHAPGVLAVEDSLFLSDEPAPPPEELRPDWADAMGGDYLYPHIASPDVHLDHSDRQIRMYFHGLLEGGDQQTRMAVSETGLSFDVKEPLLGPPYFRTFDHAGRCFAVSWGGRLFNAPGPSGPFVPGPHLISRDALPDGGDLVRHVAVLKSGDTLWVFFSCIGAKPEAIHVAEVSLTGDWRQWHAGRISKVLAPELSWEGADARPTTSVMGPSKGFSPALLDPFVFRDGPNLHMLYVGGAEYGGIGICSLQRVKAPAKHTEPLSLPQLSYPRALAHETRPWAACA